MSLINEMLHDLEKRRNEKTQQMPVVDTVMSAKTGMPGRKILGAAAAVVLLAGVVWGGFSLFPTMSAEKVPVQKPLPEQVASITPAEQQHSMAISPVTVEGETYSAPVHTVLPEMTNMPIEEQQPYPLSLDEIGDAAKDSQTAANEYIKEPAKKNVAIPPPKQEVVLTKKERLPSGDKKSYQTGLEHLRRGELEAAAGSFTSALATNPTNTRARLQLIATLQRLQQPEQAARQMRQGLELLPENRALRKEYARYLLDNRQIGKAIELLRQSPVPNVADDEEYHALLAALLQASAQYGEAANVYTRLLRIRPTNGIWWLGLAVAMDQTGNFDQAREAYRQALTLPGVNEKTREYINNRLEVL